MLRSVIKARLTAGDGHGRKYVGGLGHSGLGTNETDFTGVFGCDSCQCLGSASTSDFSPLAMSSRLLDRFVICLDLATRFIVVDASR